MKSRNHRIKQKKGAEKKKLDTKRRFRTLRIKTADEFRRRSVGKQTDEQGTLNDIIAKYLKKIDMSLLDGKKVHECVYW